MKPNPLFYYVGIIVLLLASYSFVPNSPERNLYIGVISSMIAAMLVMAILTFLKIKELSEAA